MERDPFYREIIKRLNEQLDGNTFQDCAVDLLREAYPTLVPVRGGSDAGMDGAIADGQGEPFTLVATTEEDVIGNLTHNLTVYKKEHQRRKAVLATSQKLSQRRRENLNKKARELGFILVNIHDQFDIANRLYRNSRWCLELLGLSGKPSALSKIPKSTRIQLSQGLIGQEEAFNWLRGRTSDTILVGQPAAGKTALLKHLVDVEEGAYFVVSADSAEIASEIRARRPVTLIVDDAHIQRGLLETLKHLRYDIGASFTIVASTWPSYQPTISTTLNLTSTDVYPLELLTRDQIVEVIRGAGRGVPDGLIQEIVNQAEGRPGLATTLAHLFLVSGVQDIIAGETIHQLMLEVFETLALKQRSAAILAAFALGGTRGLSIDVVSQAFGIHFLEVREIVTQLYDSGIVFDALPENISNCKFLGDGYSHSKSGQARLRKPELLPTTIQLSYFQ